MRTGSRRRKAPRMQGKKMRTKQRGLWLWVALSIIGAASAVDGTTEAVVTAAGEALIDAGGPVKARQHAIAAACDTAVARVAETMAGGDKTLDALVQGRSDAFIRHYKVLSEALEGDRYRVRIECAVAVDVIEAMVKDSPAVEDTGRPRVLLLMAERSSPQDPLQYWWGRDVLSARPASEKALARILERNGFFIIDVESVRHSTASGVLAEAGPNPHMDLLRKAAAALEADWVIAGHAGAEAGTQTTKGRPAAFRGWIQVQLVDGRRGRAQGAFREEAVAVAPDAVSGSRSAIAAAGRRMGRRLASHLDASAPGATMAADGATETVAIQVTGVQPLVRFFRFRRALAGTPGVETVQTVEVSGAEAILRVAVRGGAETLTEALRQVSLDEFQVEVAEWSDERIAVKLAGGHLP
jgi:hypothetical protein